MFTTKFICAASCAILFIFSNANAAQPPKIQQANLYYEGVDLSQYLVSEKLDGVRGRFDGEKFISKKGNPINAPKWFIENFPNQELDGELWIKRGAFEEVSGIVRQEIPNDLEWKKVRFMVFDLPKNSGDFSQRYLEMKKIIEASNSSYLKLVEQFEVADHKTLMLKLNETVKKGGEGLMLHRKDSFYKAVRNDDILKLKTFEDAEAVVISYIEGQGKLKGKMGAILVENGDKIRFKIGGGFNDEQRKNPPKIGAIITYKFYGKTKNNVPRFPSFLRIRDEI